MHYGGSEKRDAFFPAPKPVANHNIALFLLGLMISAMQMKNSFRWLGGPLDFVAKKEEEWYECVITKLLFSRCHAEWWH